MEGVVRGPVAGMGFGDTGKTVEPWKGSLRSSGLGPMVPEGSAESWAKHKGPAP